jgi:PAS domain S-box-containing protein
MPDPDGPSVEDRLDKLLEAQNLALATAQDALEFVQDVIDTLREPFVILDEGLRVIDANESFYECFQVSREETVGRMLFELGNGQRDIPRLREELSQIMTGGPRLSDFEVTYDFPTIGRKVMLLNGRRIRRDHLPESRDRILLAIEDVTRRRLAEERMATSEQRYRRLFESARDGILIIDFNTQEVVEANSFVETLLGYTHEELLGSQLWQIGLFGDNSVGQRLFRNLQHERYIRNGDLPLVAKGGHQVDVEISCNVYNEGDRRVIQFNMRDIAQRRQAEEELRASQDHLEAELSATRRLRETSSQLMSEGDTGAIYENILDTAMALMHADFASLQMLDLEKRELFPLGYRGFSPDSASFWALASIGSQGACEAALEQGRRIIVRDVETEDFMINGDELEVYLQHNICSCQSTPLSSRTGRIVGMLSTYWSRRHEPSARDLDLLDLLARQAADLIELNQSKEALRDADRRKNEFLAMLSHEIRNPLAPIASAVRILEIEPLDDDIRKESLSVLDRQLGVITRLVDDLMDVSRVTYGRIQFQFTDVDLSELVQRVGDSFRPLMSGRGHEFSVSTLGTPLWVRADATRLEQMVSNLLSNSVKYTPEGGQVWMATEREDDQALLRVRDSGIGIEPELLAHIFEWFTQGDRELDRPHSGLGIGLSLTRRLAELHGGTVTAHSEGAGQGSEFLVRLPAVSAPSVEPDPPEKGSVSSVGRRLRVLLVDDAEDTRRIFGRLLELLGHETRMARDALTGLDGALEFRPHVVLLDIGLPGTDGYELARRMRQEPALEHTVIIAVTGYGRQADRLHSLESGFDHHLVKPPDIDLLKQLLADIARSATS